MLHRYVVHLAAALDGKYPGMGVVMDMAITTSLSNSMQMNDID